jgi:iron complex outermembrane receptor protein
LFAQWGLSDATYGQDSFFNDRVLATTGVAPCNLAPPGGNLSGFTCAIGSVNYIAAVPNGFTAAELAFLTFRDIGTTEFQQSLVGGSIAGNLFELPAGDLGVALGFEYREEEIDDTPGAQAQLNNLWGQTSAIRTAGEDSVQELFAEVDVPLLAGLPLIESLTAEASYRWTEYESFGDDSTYKAGLNWIITPEYRVRGTVGTSFRAPALFEIFLGNQTGFLSQQTVDPCTAANLAGTSDPNILANCASLGLPVGYNAVGFGSATILTGGGGPGVLNAETSDARTLGVVWTPDWMDWSFALDYWDIEVNNQVAQFGSGNILRACFADPAFPASPFCTLFTRDLNPASPTFGMVQLVNNSFVNLNSQITRGLDFTARYEHEFSFGTFRIDGQFTWTFEDDIDFFTAASIPNPPAPLEFNGTLGDPDFVGNLAFRFDRGDWTYFWDVDLVGKSSNDEFFGDFIFGWRGWTEGQKPTFFEQGTDFYHIHNASIRYQTDNWTFQAGVQNVFDEPPPIVSTGFGGSRLGTSPLTSQYDLIGREYWMSVARTF